MDKRTLTRSPSILPLYARAAAPMIPGASLLPFVPGRGEEMPALELTLPDVTTDADAVAAYARVCGFTLRGTLPVTYPHVLAFPLHLALMADGRFPFGAVGLVHLENRIVQRRPIELGESLTLRTRTTSLRPHARGRTFGIESDVRVGGELVWESVSTMLRRGGGTGASAGTERPDRATANGGAPAPATAEWRLGGDLGRRYAAVSGDRNPIHMHALTAKALGFPRAIAHGMWTKARCLAALESQLPDAYAAEVTFRKPVLLPTTVELTTAVDGGDVRFGVRDARRGTPHLDGSVEPVEAGQTKTSGRKRAS